MLYHVSQTSGLKTLQPHVSTHKKLYVYAVQNIITGLLLVQSKMISILSFQQMIMMFLQYGNAIQMLFEKFMEGRDVPYTKLMKKAFNEE